MNVTWTGFSGTRYAFRMFTVGTVFNEVSGVYLLCKFTPPDSFEMLYVGETQSFYDRLNARSGEHDGYKRAQLAGITHIGLLLCGKPLERLRIEADLRQGFRPSCNREPLLSHIKRGGLLGH